MNYLTETEQMTLKHLLGFGNEKIERFESLNLDSETREFLIFDMMVSMKQRDWNKIPVKERTRGFFERG